MTIKDLIEAELVAHSLETGQSPDHVVYIDLGSTAFSELSKLVEPNKNSLLPSLKLNDLTVFEDNDLEPYKMRVFDSEGKETVTQLEHPK